MKIRRAAAPLVLLLLAACSAQTLDPPATAPPPSRALTPTKATPTPAPTGVDPAVAMTWPNADPAHTPGLVVSGCTYPRDDSERAVTASTKRAAARRYGYGYPTGVPYMEYDHRVPFSLCGANTVANIWPQPTDGVNRSAYVLNRKDQLEAFAARQVRYKRWTLTHAQGVFLGDWRVAWCQHIHSRGVVCP